MRKGEYYAGESEEIRETMKPNSHFGLCKASVLFRLFVVLSFPLWILSASKQSHTQSEYILRRTPLFILPLAIFFLIPLGIMENAMSVLNMVNGQNMARHSAPTNRFSSRLFQAFKTFWGSSKCCRSQQNRFISPLFRPVLPLQLPVCVSFHFAPLHFCILGSRPCCSHCLLFFCLSLSGLIPFLCSVYTRSVRSRERKVRETGF